MELPINELRNQDDILFGRDEINADLWSED